MAEDQDKPRTSRRAQRRAEQDQEREPEQAAEGDENADAGESKGDVETAAPAMNRRQRRAAKATGADEEDPRNQNQRLRDASRARRIARTRERQAAVTRGLDTSERVDDAVSRSTQAIAGFLRRHFNVVQWIIVLGIVGGIGYQVYRWRYSKGIETASDQLMVAVAAESGRVGEALTGDEAEFDTRRTFATEQARTKAASDAYQQIVAARGDAPLGTLGKLGLAGLRYDEGKYADAAKLYREVKTSKLAQTDSDVKHRALEGVGMALEGQGDAAGAAQAFKELGNSDQAGFAALGLYHQARMALAKGDKEGAKKLIDGVQQKLGKSTGNAEQFAYLQSAIQDLLREIDPAAAAAASSFSPTQLEALQKSMGDPSQLNQLLQQMGMDPKDLPSGGDTPAPPAPPEPPSAPAPDPAPGSAP